MYSVEEDRLQQPATAAFWSRRAALRGVAAGAAAVVFAPLAARAVTAKTGLGSPFTGEYEDPKHPGCLRSVKVVGPKLGPDGRRGRKPVAVVSGVDGLPAGAGTKACPKGEVPELKDVWKLEGTVSEDGTTLTVDFSPKTEGRVGVLVAKYDDFDPPGIQFPDGNKWVKIEGGTPERRPEGGKMKTLNSDTD
jgi:hypothetical protein